MPDWIAPEPRSFKELRLLPERIPTGSDDPVGVFAGSRSVALARPPGRKPEEAERTRQERKAGRQRNHIGPAIIDDDRASVRKDVVLVDLVAEIVGGPDIAAVEGETLVAGIRELLATDQGCIKLVNAELTRILGVVDDDHIILALTLDPLDAGIPAAATQKRRGPDETVEAAVQAVDVADIRRGPELATVPVETVVQRIPVYGDAVIDCVVWLVPSRSKK